MCKHSSLYREENLEFGVDECPLCRAEKMPRREHGEGTDFGLTPRACLVCGRDFVPGVDRDGYTCQDCEAREAEENGMSYEDYLNLGRDNDVDESAYYTQHLQALKTNGVF
jgi:hypothetical protein